jgi:hypothetical protein
LPATADCTSSCEQFVDVDVATVCAPKALLVDASAPVTSAAKIAVAPASQLASLTSPTTPAPSDLFVPSSLSAFGPAGLGHMGFMVQVPPSGAITVAWTTFPDPCSAAFSAKDSTMAVQYSLTVNGSTVPVTDLGYFPHLQVGWQPAAWVSVL